MYVSWSAILRNAKILKISVKLVYINILRIKHPFQAEMTA